MIELIRSGAFAMEAFEQTILGLGEGLKKVRNLIRNAARKGNECRKIRGGGRLWSLRIQGRGEGGRRDIHPELFPCYSIDTRQRKEGQFYGACVFLKVKLWMLLSTKWNHNWV